MAGRTGSGKTHLAMHLLMMTARLVVVDLKGTLGVWGLQPDSPEVFADILSGTRAARVRVQSVDRTLEYCEAIMAGGNCILYVDEVYALIPPGSRTPDVINSIWTRGRELGIGGWAATQRPTWLPLMMVSEADWFFVFRLTLEEDRNRMASFMGEEVTYPITDRHGVHVMRADWDKPIYYTQLSTRLIKQAQPTEEVIENAA